MADPPDDDGWTRTRWWRVLDEHDQLYMETSDPSEVLHVMVAHPDFTLEKGWRREEFEWRPEDLDTLREKVRSANRAPSRRGSIKKRRSGT